MAFIVFPAAIALIGKLYLLASPEKRAWAGTKWVAFTSVLAALNLSELLIYVNASNGVYPEQLLKIYYVCCVTGAAYAYYYVINPLKYISQKYIFRFLNVVAIAIIYLTLMTDLVVGGYAQLTQPVVAAKGAYYWLFAAHIIVTMSLVLITLLHNAINSDDRDEQIAYAFTIKAMVVLVSASIIVMTLKLLGLEANGTGLIPLATTWFVYQTALARNSVLIEKDPRTVIPLSKESQAAKQINWSHAQFGINNRALKATIKEMEFALVLQRLKENDGNKSQTARSLGISQQTLNNKLGFAESVDSKADA